MTKSPVGLPFHRRTLRRGRPHPQAHRRLAGPDRLEDAARLRRGPAGRGGRRPQLRQGAAGQAQEVPESPTSHP